MLYDARKPSELIPIGVFLVALFIGNAAFGGLIELQSQAETAIQAGNWFKAAEICHDGISAAKDDFTTRAQFRMTLAVALRHTATHEAADTEADAGLDDAFASGDDEGGVHLAFLEMDDLLHCMPASPARIRALQRRVERLLVTDTQRCLWWHIKGKQAHIACSYSDAVLYLQRALDFAPEDWKSGIRDEIITSQSRAEIAPLSGAAPADLPQPLREALDRTDVSHEARALELNNLGIALHSEGLLEDAAAAFQKGEALAQELPLESSVRRHLAENHWLLLAETGSPDAPAAALRFADTTEAALRSVADARTPDAAIAAIRQFDVATPLFAAGLDAETLANRILSTRALTVTRRRAFLDHAPDVSAAYRSEVAARIRSVSADELAAASDALLDATIAAGPVPVSPPAEWRDYAARLPEKSALVVYVLHRAWENGGIGSRYTALVIQKKALPVFIPIGPASALDFATWDAAALRQAGKALWSKIPPGMETVFVCLDGGLNNIPFACITDPQTNRSLLESGSRLVFLSTPAALLHPATEKIYDNSSHFAVLSPTPPNAPAQHAEFPFTILANASLPELPGLARERSALAKHNSRWKMLPPTERALREALREALAQKVPDILHLAGHSLNAASGKSSREAANEPFLTGHRQWSDPTRALLQSVFLFPGARTALSQPPPATENDDCLFAAELASLDLRNTKLVVLSTCDSGTGLTTSGEGSLDMAMAAHWAGARDVLVAAHPVSDTDTPAFMDCFYAGLSQGNEPAVAAWDAQRESWRKLRARPFVWCALAIIGGLFTLIFTRKNRSPRIALLVILGIGATICIIVFSEDNTAETVRRIGWFRLIRSY